MTEFALLGADPTVTLEAAISDLNFNQAAMCSQ